MRRLSLMFVIIFSLTSCGTYRYIYTASPANNPAFKEKGESHLAGYYSSSGGDKGNTYAHGLDVQVAYALTDHWAITGSYLYRKERDLYNWDYNFFHQSLVNYNRNLVEIGGGYFIALNRKKTITANMYTGVGTGKFSFTDAGLDTDSLAYTRYHKTSINKWFLQPSINFMPGKYLSITYAMKFSFVNYNNIQTNYSPDELDYFALRNLGSGTLIFTEPSLSFKVGLPEIPWLKIDVIFSGISYERALSLRGNVRTSSGSIGLNMDLTKITQKK